MNPTQSATTVAGGAAAETLELTSAEHPSGTDRVAEVAARPAYRAYETIVNVQGDEPFVRADQLEAAAPAPVDDADQEIGDDLLRLVFTACHPVLATEARVALTLRLLGGLTTVEIARAFLVAETTIAQRIVRAKRALADARVPFEVPRGEELALRLASVLEVIYLIFNEGYAATAGDDWMRPGLCEDALRLGRILAELAPGEPEVHGLVALMEIQASRSAARVALSGEPILLLDQNRARWDQLLIRRGLSALARAEALDGAGGPYALQAAIAAVDAAAGADGVTIPDILAAPMVRLVVVLAMPAVIDVDIDGRRAANVVVRRGCAGQLEEPLLLEGPPDHLHVGASGVSLQRVQRIPIIGVGVFEHLLEITSRCGVHRRRHRADRLENNIDGEPRGELLGAEIRRIAAHGPVEPEQRRR